MRRAVFVGTALVAVAGLTISAAGQGGLPDATHTLILGARSYRQANTKAPLEIRLQSGDRITVAASDVHEYATLILRSALGTQAYRAVEPSRLFVLQVREKAREVRGRRSFVNITLLSGVKFRLRAEDVEDARLTFLYTALAEARIRPVPAVVLSEVTATSS